MRVERTGYRASRADYMGVTAVRHADGSRSLKPSEAFDASRAAANSNAVRVDMDGKRHILAAAITLSCFDQGRRGFCEANAIVGGMMIARPGTPMLSRRHVALLALMRDGSYPNDNGTTGETIHIEAATTGVCLESSCRYTDVDGEWEERPSLEALEEAYDHRIDATHRILLGSRAGADVRASIDAARPVQIGGPVSQAFEDAFGGTHETLVFDELGPSIGGHAQLIVGYWERPDGSYWYLVRNSWGTGCGDAEFDGHSWYTERALRHQDELFSVMVAPTFAKAA